MLSLPTGKEQSPLSEVRAYFSGIQKGRKKRPDLEVGICGEQGGDPRSVEFCHKVGMNYVSCSPFRVPIARLAAAQAVVNEKKKI